MEPQNTQPPLNAPAPEAQTGEKKSMGPLVGALIVLLVLVLGGFYLWSAKQTQNSANNSPPFILGDDAPDAGLPPTSSSDEVATIESDISATDLNTFEAEINADLQAAESAL